MLLQISFIEEVKTTVVNCLCDVMHDAMLSDSIAMRLN